MRFRHITGSLAMISATICCFASEAPETKSSEIRLLNGRPTLLINGREQYPIIYALTDLPGGRLTWEEMPQHNIRRMAEKGVRIFQFPLFFDQIWSDERTPLDLTVVQKLIRGVTDVCPEASIMIRLHVHPPQWWYKMHRGECASYADGEHVEYDEAARFKRYQHNDPASGVIRYSFASQLWLDTMTGKVAEFCERLARTEEGKSVAAIQVAAGIYGEWHYWGFIENIPDVSSSMQAHFEDWLREKYGTEDRLRDAWNRKDVSFDSAEVPSAKDRAEANKSLFLDLSTHRNLVDYYQCQHALVADCLIHFSKTVKEHWGRPIVVGAFYGYFFPMFSKETLGGHLALERVLNSRYVDFLAGPQCYFPDAFELGEPARSRGLPATCRLHEKLWLDEYDTQPNISALTPIGASSKTPGYDQTINTAVAIVRRNMAVSAVQGQGFWFFDFGVAGGRQYSEAKDNGSNGWWDFPPLLKVIGETRSVFTRESGRPYRSDADVLMVFDTDVYYELSTDISLLAPVSAITGYNPSSAWEAGVAADYIHLDDLHLVNLKQYKVIVFNNTFRITDEQRTFIGNYVAKDGRHLIWFYAPGYSDGRIHSLENMVATTGIKLGILPPGGEAGVSIGNDAFHYQYSFGAQAVSPLFFVSDKEVTPMGVYSQNGAVAIARKELPESKAWFVGLPDQSGGVMKYVLKQTPAHIYGTDKEVFYVGNGMVIMHTGKQGLHRITLKNGKVSECLVPTGGATIIFDADTGQIIDH